MEISKTIANLRRLTQRDVQEHWHSCSQDLNPTANSWINISDWAIAPVNEKGYITWSPGRQVLWLAQKIIIPQDLNGYPLEGLSLRLQLTWWAELAQIFVNGFLVQEGDLFDSTARILLTPSAIPGEEILVTLRLISPGHDIGALMKSRVIYESGNYDDIDPGFVADELTVLHQYLQLIAPEKIEILAKEVSKIQWQNVGDRQIFDHSLYHLRNTLIPIAKTIKERRFNLLGHAHLDMAWLWTTSETYQVAQRTFISVLNLQQYYPNLILGHTTSALYFWLEQNCPKLFEYIQEAVNSGQWEILGGMWVEPEVNIVAGESIVRQLLYGQKYLEAKFGQITKVAWLPDSFGFSWQLPQIFKQAGIEYFVTGKLHWNDTTKFPHPLFWWQAPDGTKLITLMSPPNVAGVMDTNPLTMINYALEWEKETGIKDIFWLPGVGDHGGGPTRDMLEVQERWQKSPFFPDIKFTTAKKYLDKITADNKDPLPIWNDELYLEFHRGCYTTHADQKKLNRQAEQLLYEVELFISVESLINKNLDIENSNFRQKIKNIIEGLWKQVLFNQFHDILPGTSITEVFLEANKQWQEVITIGENILGECLRRISNQIDLPEPPHPDARPIFVFNSLNWERSEVVEIALPCRGNWAVYDLYNNSIDSQNNKGEFILFEAPNVPSIGYLVYWLVPRETEQPETDKNQEDFILENNYLRVVIDKLTGDIQSIFDKENQREVLKQAGNQLEFFEDKGQYWDAWNINPDYQKYPLESAQLETITWQQRGAIRSSIRVVKKFRKSLLTQDYILDVNSPILKIVNHINWEETHVLLKAVFPLNYESDFLSCEIPCGVITHPTKPKTETERAKWEVSALRWADLSNEQYGVSLLNDCKYGYDSQPDQLRLTLLRSPIWPDTLADKGTHQFTYALYPHQGNWQSAKTVHRGYELNLPLKVLLSGENKVGKALCLPNRGRFLDLQADNLILTALKPSEDDPQSYILRCYECHGEQTGLSLAGDLGLKLGQRVNLLEIDQEMPRVEVRETTINPWQIASFRVVG
jgi:alpha-mannosidase